MRIQGEDLARVVVAGLAAAFLAGLLTVLWTAPEPLPQATLIGAVVVIGLITAAGYRHVGALAAAGAVLLPGAIGAAVCVAAVVAALCLYIVLGSFVTAYVNTSFVGMYEYLAAPVGAPCFPPEDSEL